MKKLLCVMRVARLKKILPRTTYNITAKSQEAKRQKDRES
ncbi:hypothetical protein HMPREF7215_0700 [Pyramidobacter piscolens W5455]|uniref:Uncharacterized protein n=1 Tax=Pyramidobacter piscolens W5455 TaxID=352165 RepID=A0ABM9ZSM1_9BACT|nr:hypothetical protein HMPREF7215_0700 [Pyramidobacter piscolens W5455]